MKYAATQLDKAVLHLPDVKVEDKGSYWLIDFGSSWREEVTSYGIVFRREDIRVICTFGVVVVS